MDSGRSLGWGLGGYFKWRDNDLKDALTVKWSGNVMDTTHTCSLWGRRVTSSQVCACTSVLTYNHRPRSNVWRNADTISFYRIKAVILTSSSPLHHSFLPTKKRKICINISLFPPENLRGSTSSSGCQSPGWHCFSLSHCLIFTWSQGSWSPLNFLSKICNHMSLLVIILIYLRVKMEPKIQWSFI